MEDSRHDVIINCVVTFAQQLQGNILFRFASVFTNLATVLTAHIQCHGMFTRYDVYSSKEFNR
jgi:hypothetical protein